MVFSEIDSRRRAVQKMKTLRAFYQHLLVFILMNAIIIIYNWNIFGDGATQFRSLGTYITTIIWGIGLFWHLIYVLIYFFFKNNWLQKWEEKKIRQFIDKQ